MTISRIHTTYWRKWGTSMEFKKGDFVWCESPSPLTNWKGLAIVHSKTISSVGLIWITCGSTHFYYNHADGCDAYVPTEWLTKVEGELWSSTKVT